MGGYSVKNEEMPPVQHVWKSRAVFQGNNVRTKTGVSAVELYEEVSNAPASFTMSRCALAVAAVRRMEVSVRDAEQAYLQAFIDGEGRIPTWVEILCEW